MVGFEFDAELTGIPLSNTFLCQIQDIQLEPPQVAREALARTPNNSLQESQGKMMTQKALIDAPVYSDPSRAIAVSLVSKFDAVAHSGSAAAPRVLKQNQHTFAAG